MTDGLLLIHAFPIDSRMWENQIEHLSGRVPVRAVDLPGFGATAPGGEVLTMQAAAEHCAAELDRAEIERAVVCGLSLGGYVALEFWRRYRDRVLGLVLANTRAEADNEEGKERRRAVAEKARAEGSEAIAQGMQALLSEEASAEVRSLVEQWIGEQSPDAIAAASLGMAERPDSTGDLASIDVPTLVIASTGDTLISSDITAPMAERIPKAELGTIEGAGHLSNLERPEEFNRLLEQHLQRCGV